RLPPSTLGPYTTLFRSDHAAQTLAFSKIMLDQDLPGGLHACRNTGKTVARQVGQAAVAVLKEVDRLRAPGGLAGAGEIPALTNGIERAGFAGIGAAGEGHFCAIRWRQGGAVWRCQYKLHVLEFWVYRYAHAAAVWKYEILAITAPRLGSGIQCTMFSIG